MLTVTAERLGVLVFVDLENLLRLWRLLRIWIIYLVWVKFLHLFFRDEATLVSESLFG